MVLAVEEVSGESIGSRGRFGGLLDVSFVVCLERLFELYFFGMSFGVEEFSLDTEELLGR